MPGNEMHQLASISPGTLPESLTAAQGLAMAALLLGKTATSAAQAAGVNRSTVWRWMHNDAVFMAFYNAARAEMRASVEQSLRLMSATAVVTLRRLLTRRSVPDAVKLGAAVAVIKLTANPIDGPVEPDDAKIAIQQRKGDRYRKSLSSKLWADKDPT